MPNTSARRVLHLLAAPVILIGAILPLAAQDRAAISGTVTDPSGATVEGAEVELSSPLNGFRRTAITGTDGIYEFSSLAVGTYTLATSKDGFKPYEISGVDLLY